MYPLHPAPAFIYSFMPYLLVFLQLRHPFYYILWPTLTHLTKFSTNLVAAIFDAYFLMEIDQQLFFLVYTCIYGTVYPFEL